MPTVDTQRFVSFGIVKSATTSTATRMTTNLSNPTGAELCQAFSFQALSNGTGSIYVCNTTGPVLTDGVQLGVLWEVPPPNTSAPISRPLFAVGNPTGPDPLNAAELYVLPVVAGEGLRCSGIR